LLALLRHPDQLALLRSDASLFANLPDELLRYDGTVQLVNRVTETSVEVGGVTIPAGETVFTLLGAGNHDPAHYPDPDRLDVTRTDVHPLTFGGGVHFCLGAALARAEIGITFRTLLRRFDHIELRGEEPRFQDRLTLRGLTALNVECRAASSARPSAAAVTAAVATEVKALAAASELEERGLRRAGDPTPTCAGAPSCASASRARRRARIRCPCRRARVSRPQSGSCCATPCSSAARGRSWSSSPRPPTR
jgi:hypothetical protein